MNAVLRSILFIAVICALIFIACSFGKKASYKNVGTDEFERLIADKAVQILDSRSKAEYDEGHIEGAILIDVNDSSFKAKASATQRQACCSILPQRTQEPRRRRHSLEGGLQGNKPGRRNNQLECSRQADSQIIVSLTFKYTHYGKQVRRHPDREESGSRFRR